MQIRDARVLPIQSFRGLLVRLRQQQGAKRSLFTFTGASSGVSSIFHNKYPSYNSYSSGCSVDFVMNRVVAKQKTEKKATGLRKWIRILVKKTPQSSL